MHTKVQGQETEEREGSTDRVESQLSEEELESIERGLSYSWRRNRKYSASEVYIYIR